MMFLSFENNIKDKHFQDVEDIQRNVTSSLNSIPTTDLKKYLLCFKDI